MRTANAVTLHVPRCKSSGAETRALSSDLHAHYECSDFNMCTANAVTDVPRCKSSGAEEEEKEEEEEDFCQYTSDWVCW